MCGQSLEDKSRSQKTEAYNAEDTYSMKSTIKSISILLLLFILAGSLAGCNKQDNDFLELEDFEDAKIGVMLGSSFDLLAKERFPKAERVYYHSLTDLILNLKKNKIDGILMDMGYFAPLGWEHSDLTYIETDMPATSYAVAFPKTASSEPLMEQMNEFILKQTENGWLDEMYKKWFGSVEPVGKLDMSELTGENGTIRVAITVECKPFSYMKNGEVCGFDADFIFQFAKEYGYSLEMDDMNFGALLPSLSAGRYDMAIAGITVTDERKESVHFSDAYYRSPIVMAVQHSVKASPKTLADLETATIGIVTGTNWDAVAETKFPNAERKYFTSSVDAAIALEQGKIDAFFADKTVYAGMRWENENLNALDEPIENISNALILPREGYDETLLSQINAFVAKTKKDGTLDALADKWFGESEPTEHPDYQSLTGENGTVKIAVGDSMKPTAYQRGNLYTGYEVDFLTMFAEEYGYRLEIEGMAFEALIPYVASNKCDIGACGITVTPERAESVKFTDTHFKTHGVAVVRNEKASSVGSDVQSLKDLENGTVAVLTGTIWDGVASEELPTVDIKHYSSTSDMLLSMRQGKIDAILGDRSFYTGACWENVPVRVLDETVGSISCGLMMSKENCDEVLRGQLNEFIAQSRANGFLDSLAAKWFADTEPTEHPDYQSLTGENGTISVAVDDTAKPMTYQRGDFFTGFDVDLLTEFARAYGYKLEIEGMTFSGLIPAVSGGRYDISACGTAITPERMEAVSFTDSYLEIDGVVMVSEGDPVPEKNSVFDDIADSFEKTFIREDRWKLILEGVGVTLLISICSAICGTLLGLGLYMLSRSRVRGVRVVTRGLCKCYSRLVAGTPVVVILMILFYVVFGKIRDMSGILVAIIGFTLTFGAFVYDHITVSVSSVDHGQTEAAYALGYTKNKTFFRIVFPQAMKVFMPSYCGQSVELVKATAVVGYIAVNDLTKMGDIIRSNTYEAFFPLIATALIYFLLTWGLLLLLKLATRHFEPHRRTKERILKGLKTE